jgi:hypothetical protein
VLPSSPPGFGAVGHATTPMLFAVQSLVMVYSVLVVEWY